MVLQDVTGVQKGLQRFIPQCLGLSDARSHFRPWLQWRQWRRRTYFEVVVYSVRTMPIELRALGVAGFSQCAM